MRGCVSKRRYFVDINEHILVYTHELVKQHVRIVTAADGGECTTSTLSLSNLHDLLSSLVLWRAIIINIKSISLDYERFFPRYLFEGFDVEALMWKLCE
jgi:hypothetical protein